MASIIFGRGVIKRIGDIEVDASFSEQTDFSNTVTSHPIEGGGVVSDHVYANPTIISMNCIISNASFSGDGLTRAVDGYERLKVAFEQREPITIVNALDVFQGMVIEALSVPRTAETADAVIFNITLRQVTIANSQTTTIGNAAPSVQKDASSKANAGRATPKQPTVAQSTSARNAAIRENSQIVERLI